MRINVYVINGQVATFDDIDRVVLHLPGETRTPVPGLLALSAANVLGWEPVRDAAPAPPAAKPTVDPPASGPNGDLSLADRAAAEGWTRLES